MKTTPKSIIAGIALAMAGVSYAGDSYVGLHFTVPLGSKEGQGIQIVLREDNLEMRAGLDSNQRYQFGGGITGGANTTASAGFSYSNYHRGLVPYAAASTEVYQDYEVGAVSYYGNLNYGYLGVRWGDDDENDGKGRRNTLSDGGSGTGDSDSGDSGGSDDDTGGSGGNGGGGSGSGGAGGSNNHSGQGDGTNPGNTDQDNGGEENPSGGA